MKKIYVLALILACLAVKTSFSQAPNTLFSRADSLRGTLNEFRSSYDINYYHLNVKLDIENKFISGSNLFKFTAVNDIKTLQFDLFDHLVIEKVVYKGSNLPFKREFNAVFVDFPSTIKKGNSDEFTVFYSGNTIVAKRAPWDGGFSYAKDKQGKPWVAVSCQGFGASSWWPNKDHQSDEVDSMMISVSVPKGLMNVSNGRLRSTENTDPNYSKYNWFVSYPINNYNVTLNIADYAYFNDSYAGENGDLTLDYYVLKENLEKAQKQFNANVKPMFKSFEHWFGPYPFYRDGFKLVETPYLGMEHQSAVAYGNKYLNGYLGRDLSGTGLGMGWDYIIIHETGHEWFGNNITTKDIADMWVHEGFTQYSEALFVESRDGKEAGAKYIKGLRKNINNDRPVIGPKGVNQEGSGDMYPKGANLIHMTRTIIDDDKKWREILRGMNSEFGLKTCTSKDIVDYISQKSGIEFKSIYSQYLRSIYIPILEYKTQGKQTRYRWIADEAAFDMPIRIESGKNYSWIYPTSEWQIVKTKDGFKPDLENFYIKINEVK